VSPPFLAGTRALAGAALGAATAVGATAAAFAALIAAQRFFVPAMIALCRRHSFSVSPALHDLRPRADSSPARQAAGPPSGTRRFVSRHRALKSFDCCGQLMSLDYQQGENVSVVIISRLSHEPHLPFAIAFSNAPTNCLSGRPAAAAIGIATFKMLHSLYS
jgi:hypothetical protein